MPVPASYSEATALTFMVTELSDVGTALGWTTATAQLEEALYDALFGYFGGSGVIADATDLRQLRALLRVAAWRAAVKALAAQMQFSADGQSVSRQQLQEMALKALALAETDAQQFGGSAAIRVDSVTFNDDPYQPAALVEF